MELYDASSDNTYLPPFFPVRHSVYYHLILLLTFHFVAVLFLIFEGTA